MQHFRAHHGPRRGFTLVEMLVVITIIGILVALLIPTVAGVMRRTRNAAMAVELQGLAEAVEAYKAKNNDYFPDFTNIPAVIAHIQRAYPRCTKSAADITTWVHTNEKLDSAEALVFWLSETRNNVRDPLTGAGEKVSYFAFDETRLVDGDGDGFKEYYSKYAKEAPYVYFDGRVISVAHPTTGNPLGTHAYAWAVYPSPYDSSNQRPSVPKRDGTGIPKPTAGAVGIIRPFRSNVAITATDQATWQNTTTALTTKWVEPGKYQIITPGQDNHFGDDIATLFKSYPVPISAYTGTADEDNITSFSEMKTFEEATP